MGLVDQHQYQCADFPRPRWIDWITSKQDARLPHPAFARPAGNACRGIGAKADSLAGSAQSTRGHGSHQMRYRAGFRTPSMEGHNQGLWLNSISYALLCDITDMNAGAARPSRLSTWLSEIRLNLSPTTQLQPVRLAWLVSPSPWKPCSDCWRSGSGRAKLSALCYGRGCDRGASRRVERYFLQDLRQKLQRPTGTPLSSLRHKD